MAGHNKWANIKNRKGAQDKRKAKIFAQLARQIKTAVQEGGSGDPNQNPTLRTYLDKARIANMSNENIKRAIDRGLGKSATGQQFQEIVYEGYGPGGVGILVTAVTDNLNRTSSEIRRAFSMAGGSLGGPGSVMYMFQRADSGDESYICTMPMQVTDESTQEKVQELMDVLLDNDDVEEVFCAGVWAGQE